MLYPLKFQPYLFHKIWGGHHIKGWYAPQSDSFENVGESWVISAVEKYPTTVINGSHIGDDLQELLDVYMDELVGEKVYDTFGNTFPVLLKFIDADDDLSIQVHPDDEYAAEKEDSLGKTEMWYVLDSEPDASVVLGWNHSMDESTIREAIADGTLMDHLTEYPVSNGDSVIIHSGTVHAMKRGTRVAEIQENSDITYRLYDYNRVGNDGKTRPLKLDKALEAMSFEPLEKETLTHHTYSSNGVANLAKTPYFTTNVLSFNRTIERDYAPLDSFVAYMCVEGEVMITAPEAENDEQTVSLHQGEAVLIPAILNDVVLQPKGQCRLLEVYIDTDNLK